MPNHRTVADVPATPHFPFIHGAYRLSSWVIPYFSATMSLRQAAASLRLATDFPGAERVRWRLEELYQRDIDWPRVERSIVPYLMAQNQPQFFNALTIALLPLTPSGQLAETFGEGESWTAPPLEQENERFQKTLRVGPVSLGFWEGWDSLSDAQARTGELRWNPAQVFSVALDGQHRLAAIQRLAATHTSDSGRFDTTAIPVVLLILDPLLGYEAPPNRSLVEILRILFVDLNKHAQSVSRARQILLDDKDPHSSCVRALVGPQLLDGFDELEADPPRLPLSLVDWHTEQAKFDEGPYVTTVLGLDWIVTKVLGARPIADYMDYGTVGRQIKALSVALGIDLGPATQRLVELKGLEAQPFSYTEGEVEAIAAAFRHVWNQPTVKLLSGFQPYASLKGKRASMGLGSVEFANWYQLYDRKKADRYAGRATDEYRQLIGRLANRPVEPVAESCLVDGLQSLHSLKQENLAFTVAFQRAYILGFLDYRQITSAHENEINPEPAELPDFDEADEETGPQDGADVGPEDGGEDDDDSQAQPTPLGGEQAALASHLKSRAQQYVEAMNALITSWPEFLDVNATFSSDGEDELFWLGSLRKAEGGIDFTQGASSRAAEIFSCVGAMSLYDSVVESDSTSQFDEFWAEVLEKNGYVVRRVARAIRRFADHTKEGAAAVRILKARDKTVDEQSCRELARTRLEWLWEKLGL